MSASIRSSPTSRSYSRGGPHGAIHSAASAAEFFQHGYVTSDFDRALKHFSAYGITRRAEMREIDDHLIGDRHATLSFALGYLGALQIEVIQPHTGHCAIRREILPASGFALGLHHHGFLVRDEAEYTALGDAYAWRGAPTVIDPAQPALGESLLLRRHPRRARLLHGIHLPHAPGN